MAHEGRFREDLLDRLSFEVITLPPLRARREDILLLAGHFARRMAAELGLTFMPEFSERSRRTLLDHPWPGNVRQLKNVVERMVYRSPAAVIEAIDFDPFDSPFAPPTRSPHLETAPDAPGDDNGVRAAPGAAIEGLDQLPLADAVRALEVSRLRRALQSCQFNQRKAAESLGLSYDQFRGYYRKYRRELAE
jgi:psp operon transcriptional activator